MKHNLLNENLMRRLFAIFYNVFYANNAIGEIAPIPIGIYTPKKYEEDDRFTDHHILDCNI